MLGVWARDLSAASLFEAIRARRTYAATGDRIRLDATLNGQPMGSELPPVADRQFDVRVEGQDAVSMVEIVRNGQVIHRQFPDDHAPAGPTLPGRAKCRIQYGWGPWGALNVGKTCPWDLTITIDGGRFLDAVPCFQSGPYEEGLRDRLRLVSPHEIHLESHTARAQSFAEDPTKAVVCLLDGGPDAVLSVKLRKPVEQTVRARLAELVEDNVVTFIGAFTSESHMIHPLVGPERYSATFRFVDQGRRATRPDWYYVRVTEHNGHLAWSSPFWVG